jgi:predicted ATP-binding protein involved in virulence
MKLRSLHLRDYRSFADTRIHFEEDVTVLVGINGAGKTAILDAIACALGQIVAKIPGIPADATPSSHDLVHEDIRVLEKDRFAASVHLAAEFEDQIEFARVLRALDREPRSDPAVELTGRSLEQHIDSLFTRVIGGEAASLPVFAYFGTDRASGEPPERRRNFRTQFQRFDAYENALDPAADFKAWFEWFAALEREYLEERNLYFDSPEVRGWLRTLGLGSSGSLLLPPRPPPEESKGLQAVKQALKTVLNGISSPRVLSSPLRMVVNKALPDGTIVELSLNQLSDGYRSMLAMVMDFSRRLVQANPHLENPLEAKAILLIDEVDLHLHPKWQQEVIPSLRRAFPNTQLILTTHSPQVLTTIDTRSIRILREDRVESAPPGTNGAESKRMLETVLGTESRPPGNPAVAALARLFECIREDNLEEAKRLADELDGSFGGNDPSIDEARVLIENRQWEKEAGL